MGQRELFAPGAVERLIEMHMAATMGTVLSGRSG